jgi:hypothetical protein
LRRRRYFAVFFHASACDLTCLASASVGEPEKAPPAAIAALRPARRKIDVCRSHFILINDNEDDEIGFFFRVLSSKARYITTRCHSIKLIADCWNTISRGPVLHVLLQLATHCKSPWIAQTPCIESSQTMATRFDVCGLLKPPPKPSLLFPAILSWTPHCPDMASGLQGHRYCASCVQIMRPSGSSLHINWYAFVGSTEIFAVPGPVSDGIYHEGILG